MLQCWRHNASRRPTFIDILDYLAPKLNDQFRRISFYYSQPPENDPPSEPPSTPPEVGGPEIRLEMAPVSSSGKMPLPVDDQTTGLLSGDAKTPEKTRSSLSKPAPAVEQSMPPVPAYASSVAESTVPLLAETTARNRTDDPYSNSSIGILADKPKEVPDIRRTIPSIGNSSAYKEMAGKNGGCGKSSGGVAGHKNGFINGHVIPYDCLPEARC